MISLNNKEPLFLIFCFLGSIALLFIISPIIGMTFNSSINELVEAAEDKEIQNSISLTLITSMAATLIFAVFSIPFAYVLARKDFFLKGLIKSIINIPIIIPHSAAGIAVLSIISRDSLIGRIGQNIGIDFVNNPPGIIVAMAFVSLPFLINAAYDGFKAVPVHLEKTALNLGASHTKVFFTISLPLAWRSILTGLVLMWARGMSEFGAVVIVAYNPMITPVLIFERFNAFGLKYSRPAAIIFIAVCLVFFISIRLLSSTNKSSKKTRSSKNA